VGRAIGVRWELLIRSTSVSSKTSTNFSGQTKFSLTVDGENTKHEIFAGQTLVNEAAVWFGTMAEFKSVGVDSRKNRWSGHCGEY